MKDFTSDQNHNLETCTENINEKLSQMKVASFFEESLLESLKL